MTWEQYKDIFKWSDIEPLHMRSEETNGARNYGDRELLKAFADELFRRIDISRGSMSINDIIRTMLTEVGVER